MNSLDAQELHGVPAQLRLGIWHRSILENSRPEPYGILLTLQPIEMGQFDSRQDRLSRTEFGSAIPAGAVLSLDLGGNKFLSILKG